MKLLFCSALLACFCSALFADDLGVQGTVQVGSNYIDFGTTLTGGAYEPAPGLGVFQVTSVGSGSAFASGGVTANEMGTVQSLNEGAGPVTLPSAFITFTGAGGSSDALTATSIAAGSVGPFTLTDTAQGAEATFEVLGYIGSNTANTFAAEFAIGFSGYTVADLFTNLPLDEKFCGNIDASGTPTVCDPFPAVTGTPEPSYFWLIGAGSGAGLIRLTARSKRLLARAN